MIEQMKKARILNANTLKLAAALFMLVDHTGLILFPLNWTLRKIGRIAMPLFSFAISEGCRYTRDKVKHLTWMLSLGILFSVVFYAISNMLYMCILVTFSFSVVTIYALQHFKKLLFSGEKWNKVVPALLLFLLCIAVTAAVCHIPGAYMDYGFWGSMLPVFASLFDFRGIDVPERIRKLDNLPTRIFTMGVGVLALCYFNYAANPVIYYSLLALPILLLYNGEKGKRKMKAFFYVFYPLHLVLLAGIYLLIC